MRGGLAAGSAEEEGAVVDGAAPVGVLVDFLAARYHTPDWTI
jgi:hypothetical protein